MGNSNILCFHFFQIIQNFQISMPPGVSNVKIQYKLFTTPAEKVEMYFKNRQNV